MRCCRRRRTRRSSTAAVATAEAALLLCSFLLQAGCRGQAADAGKADGGGSPPAALRGHDTERARRENEQAFELIRQAKYADAEVLLRKALEADPSYGPALNNLGLAHYKLDRLYDAAWEFESAARLMPRQPEPQNNLGLVLERAGKLPAALAAYEKAHGLAPDSPEYLGNLARARVRGGDLDEQTRALLEQVVLRDSRPDWQAWARASLMRVRPPATEPVPAAPAPPVGPRMGADPR